MEMNVTEASENERKCMTLRTVNPLLDQFDGSNLKAYVAWRRYRGYAVEKI